MLLENSVTRFGLDERNIARLNPVLALSRVHLSMTAWSKTTMLDSQGLVRLTCDAGKHQVPHGLDADVIFALLTTYHLQGRAEDHTIHISVGYLCDLVGLDRSASKYQRIQESIQRLKAVQFRTEAFWAKQTKKGWQWMTMEFGIIDYIGATDEFEELRDVSGKYGKKTSLTIRLNKELVTSIQNDYTRRIDLDFYSKLKHPLSRLLYRVLEEQRQIVGKDIYQVPIMGWGEHLGFCEIDPSAPLPPTGIPVTKIFGASRIRRALQPAHDELLARRYLSDVSYTGYATQQSLTYIFSSESVTNPIDIELAGKLVSRGIADKTARKCIISHGHEVIERAIAIFDTRTNVGYNPKSKGGFMMDIINNPDKYANVIADSKDIHKVLNDSKKIQTISIPENLPDEPAPERDSKQANILLLAVLQDTHADRELRSQVVDAFVRYEITTEDFLSLGRLSDADARTEAQRLLTHTSVE